MDKLTALLLQYQKQLSDDVGLPVTADGDTVAPDVVLLALEEMLGIESGGMALGEALEKWLSQPARQRQPIRFADLEAQWTADAAEVSAMAERHLG